jgi:hypothetical protein
MHTLTKTEIAATLFLHEPSISTLGALCETGDFGADRWTLNRRVIGLLLREIKNVEGAEVSVGRNLARRRTYRRVYCNGWDITSTHDPRLGRLVSETHHTVNVETPSFAILVKGPRFEYVFGSTFKPLGEGVDLEALQRKIKGP